MIYHRMFQQASLDFSKEKEETAQSNVANYLLSLTLRVSNLKFAQQ